MKNLFKLVVLLTFAFILGACKKEETVYSCDPEINKYAIENMGINQQITRKELSNLPFEYQNAVFLSLTYQNRLRIFKEKIDLVLNTINELSEDEKDALLMLRNVKLPSLYMIIKMEKSHIPLLKIGKRWLEKI